MRMMPNKGLPAITTAIVLFSFTALRNDLHIIKTVASEKVCAIPAIPAGENK